MKKWVRHDPFGPKADGMLIGADGESPVCCMTGYHGREITEANARLIAAAPDMLAELKRLYEKHGYQSTADVIAKAEKP